MKDSLYEELANVINRFPEYHLKGLLGDLRAKVGRRDIPKLTVGVDWSSSG
jgi:hypothetical protein